MEQNNILSQYCRSILIAALPFLFYFIISGCTEEPVNISPNNLPNDGSMEVYVKTIPVELFSIHTDALPARSIGISPFGSVNDGEIGNLQTEFLADFIYSEEPSFSEDTDLDSVQVLDLVIDLVYNRNLIYGGKGAIQSINKENIDVYELLEPIPLYSKSDFLMLPHMYDPEPLDIDFSYDAKTYTNNTIDVNDTIHIFLDNSFAQRFLDTLLINEGIYNSENQQLFKEYFKGFYFKVQPRTTKGGVIIPIDHSYSSMTLRTIEWNDNDDKWDTISNVFTLGNPDSEIDSGGVHLNIYRNALSADLAAALDDTVSLEDHAYIQSLTGPQVYVKIPGLSALRDSLEGLASVNRAQLILPLDMDIYEEDKDLFATPYMLGLFDSKSNSAVIDFSLAENHLGGKLDSSDMENCKYIINLENHIHNYLRNSDSDLSNSFYLFAATVEEETTSSGIKVQYLRYIKYNPVRAILNGSSSSNPPYLRIVYSKLNE